MLHAALDGDCPYGAPPRIESSDGSEPDAAKGNWLIDGKERNVFSPPCRFIVTTPDACAPCALNPRNRPAPSARLSLLFYIEAMQSAGAVFAFGDLKPHEWEGLLLLKSERQRFDREQWEKKRRN